MRFLFAEIERWALARQLRRVGLVWALWVLLSGLFSSTQVGCLSPDTYYCGHKNSFNSCWRFAKAADCAKHSFCEWRVGCASGCLHASIGAECSEHLGGSVGGEPLACFSGRCDATTEEACTALEDCFWEPSCGNAPNTECNNQLGEDECKRRNCEWVLLDSHL